MPWNSALKFEVFSFFEGVSVLTLERDENYQEIFFQHLRHSSPWVSNVMCFFKHHELLAESHVIEVRKYNILLRWKNLYFFIEFECLYKKFE